MLISESAIYYVVFNKNKFNLYWILKNHTLQTMTDFSMNIVCSCFHYELYANFINLQIKKNNLELKLTSLIFWYSHAHGKQ